MRLLKEVGPVYAGLPVSRHMGPSTSCDINWLYDVGKVGNSSDLPFL